MQNAREVDGEWLKIKWVQLKDMNSLLGDYAKIHRVARIDAALPRTTAREIRSMSHDVSRLSPVAPDTCLPSLLRKSIVEGPRTPVVSTETGSNRYLSVMLR